MFRRIKVLMLLASAAIMVFTLQACLMEGSDSKDGSGGTSIEGKWLLVRDVFVFSYGGESVRDTIEAPDDTYDRTFLEINGTTFRMVAYDFFTEGADSTLLSASALGGSNWRLDGDSVTVVRTGNMLRITSDYDGMSVITEYELHTGAFPPVEWGGVVDTSGGDTTGTDTSGVDTTTVTGELWLTEREIYTWSGIDGSGSDTLDYDTSDPEQMLFLNIRGDTLLAIDYQEQYLVSASRVNSTTWNLGGGDTLKIISKTSTQLVFTISGYDAEFQENFTTRVTLSRYTGAFPPAGWDEEAPTDANEPNNTSSQATSLTVGASAKAAALTVGDADWYSFQAVSGTSYTIQTTGTTDTYLRLYETNGSTLIEDDDDSGDDTNGLIGWTASSSGRHYFSVRGYGDGQAGAYMVRVTNGLALKAAVSAPSSKPRSWRK